MAAQPQLGLCAERGDRLGADHRIDSGVATADLSFRNPVFSFQNCQDGRLKMLPTGARDSGDSGRPGRGIFFV